MTSDKAEAELRRSEHRYRNLFQAMAASFWEVDFAPLGKMLQDLRGQGVTDFQRYFAENPKYVRRLMSATRVVDVNDQTVTLFGRGEKDELLCSVEPFWPEASSGVFAASVLAAVERRPNYAAETRLQTVEGREMDVLFTACFPAENIGKGTLLIGVIDITERRQAQAMLAQVQADFAHAARVSMLGELTASIAHEVNQPLAAIATNAAAGARWISQDEPDVAEVKALITRIQNDATRAADIISRIRGMAAGRAPERSMLSLNTVIEEALVFLSHEIERQGVLVTLSLEDELSTVLGDRTQLQQVVVNLAANALQAMSDTESPRLHLSTRNRGAEIAIQISDNGPGLSCDSPSRIFESFVTTKATGMGMGLAICRSIIDAHGGRIVALDQSEALGACFEFTLPVPQG